MQIKDQVKRNWKVVTAAAAVSAIGITGLAMAQPERGGDGPDAINLNDRTEVGETTTTTDLPVSSVSRADRNRTSFNPMSRQSPGSPNSPNSPESPDSADSP